MPSARERWKSKRHKAWLRFTIGSVIDGCAQFERFRPIPSNEQQACVRRLTPRIACLSISNGTTREPFSSYRHMTRRIALTTYSTMPNDPYSLYKASD